MKKNFLNFSKIFSKNKEIFSKKIKIFQKKKLKYKSSITTHNQNLLYTSTDLFNKIY